MNAILLLLFIVLTTEESRVAVRWLSFTVGNTCST